MCNWQATKLKNSTEQVAPIYPIISKTCNSQDSQTCINQGAYLLILNCGCSDHRLLFSYILYTQEDMAVGQIQLISFLIVDMPKK